MMKKTATPRTPPTNNQSPGASQISLTNLPYSGYCCLVFLYVLLAGQGALPSGANERPWLWITRDVMGPPQLGGETPLGQGRLYAQP